MFEVGKTYRHVNSTDLDIKVLAIPNVTETIVELKAVFIFKRTGGLLIIPSEEYGDISYRLLVKVEDLQNWEEVN